MEHCPKKYLQQFSDIMHAIQIQNNMANQSLYLIAGENYPSISIKYALCSDFGNRVAEGLYGNRYFPGLIHYDRIERIGTKVIRDLFGYPYVDIRPISGTIANAVVYAAFTKPGDTIMSLGVRDGGHVSMAGSLLTRVFKLRIIEFPFDKRQFNIDLQKARAIILKEKPVLIIMGGSVILFPQPIREIAIIAKKIGAFVMYDASHVAGLIAGGKFQDPFKEGADIVTLTTCKTIPGPQGAIILSKKCCAERLSKSVFPMFVSSHHLHEKVGAIIAFLEMKAFGKIYADTIVKNARTLGKELATRGFKVFGEEKGFTKTHMLLLDCAELGGGVAVEKKLEATNILVNRNMIPGYNDDYRDPRGVRIGVQEVTHIGMKENDMLTIARLFKKILIDHQPLSQIRKEVLMLRQKYSRTRYSFDNFIPNTY